MDKNSIELIKEIRKQNRMTIVELAKRMGVSQAYIVRLERGEIQPTQEQLETIKQFLERRRS